MINFKKIYLLFSLVLIGGLILWHGSSFFSKIRFRNVSNYLNPVALTALKSKLKSSIHVSVVPQNIDIYTGNFVSSDIPAIKSKQNINILFLGSLGTINLQDLKQYDFVFASTSNLHNFLTANQQKSYLLPSFIEHKDFQASACALHPENQNCFIAVIGDQPEVLQVLNKTNTPYRSYTKLNQKIEDELLSEMQNISAVIVNDSAAVEHSMDTAPFFFYAVAHRIPILSDNISRVDGITNMHNFNITSLFADTLSYYTYESDIYDFLNCLECRLKKAQKAYFLLNHLYTAEVAAQNITSVLINKTEYYPRLSDLVTILSPTHAGLYNNGDYWISKDLENAFEKIYKQVLTVFGLSIYPYLGNVSIYIRGTTPLKQDLMQIDNVALMYLIFPFTDKENADDYALSMQKEFNHVDAVAIASLKVAQAAQKLGIKAYYLPQFTNTQKFYPDYDESKKSEVLFVGQNDFYRRAARIVFDADLPITIYGSNWEGLAKAEYIDNKILRQYYSSAKIVLNDTRPNMKNLGFISNRIFDVTAAGGFLISDYIPEIEEIYGDSIPMWKTDEELLELVRYYLSPEHEAERQEKAKRAYEITVKNFTSDIAAQKFKQIIDALKRQKDLIP